MRPYFIGIGHHKQTGKGSFAIFLAEGLRDLGVPTVIRHFATPIKELLMSAFGATYDNLYGPAEAREVVPPAWVRKSTGGKTWREVAQIVGCHMRDEWEGVWLCRAFKDFAGLPRATPPVVIIEDMRFFDEYAMVKQYGGETFCLLREAAPYDPHYSEHVLDSKPYDRVVRNDGTLEDLKKVALIHARRVRGTLLTSPD